MIAAFGIGQKNDRASWSLKWNFESVLELRGAYCTPERFDHLCNGDPGDQRLLWLECLGVGAQSICVFGCVWLYWCFGRRCDARLPLKLPATWAALHAASPTIAVTAFEQETLQLSHLAQLAQFSNLGTYITTDSYVHHGIR